MSTSINTTRRVVREETASVAVAVRENKGKAGGALITLNGKPALVITANGFLRRVRGLNGDSGVRLLEDGRIAMEPINGSSQG